MRSPDGGLIARSLADAFPPIAPPKTWVAKELTFGTPVSSTYLSGAWNGDDAPARPTGVDWGRRAWEQAVTDTRPGEIDESEENEP